MKKAALETLLRIKIRLGNTDLPPHLQFPVVKPLLEKGLREPSVEYRDLCIEVALQYPAEARPWLIDSASESRDASIRHETMRALMRSGSKHLRIVLFGLGDTSDQVRAYFASHLDCVGRSWSRGTTASPSAATSRNPNTNSSWSRSCTFARSC